MKDNLENRVLLGAIEYTDPRPGPTAAEERNTQDKPYHLVKHTDYRNSDPIARRYPTRAKAEASALCCLDTLEYKYGARVELYKNGRYIRTIWKL